MKTITQCILLTGANSGIGLSTCKLLSEQGYYIFAGVRDNNGFEFLTSQNIQNVQPVRLDLTDPQQIADVAKRIEEHCSDENKFFAIINNAAFALGGPIELMDSHIIKNSFDVNVFGIIELIKQLLSILRKDKGRIINVSSTNAIVSLPYLGIYSATKFALEAISDSLRLELKKWNIPVSVIYPDVVKTPIFDKSIPLSYQKIESNDSEKQKLYKNEFDNFVKAINKMVSKGVEPEVIAKCILECLQSKKPKISYIPEKNGKITFLLKRLASKKMLDKILINQLSKV